MLTYPQIDPVAVHLGPLSVHWYGLMYLFGFLSAWLLLSWRARDPKRGFTQEQVSDILFYGALGIILGGRLGYVLFYEFPVFIAEPWRVFMIWQGGMSFHGGLLGVVVAMALYARKIHKSFGELTDFIVPVVPVGLGAGRIGNFINGELWGRVTDVPWAMIFPRADEFTRHPSQLYEFFFEGVVLFLILWIYSRKLRPTYAVSSLFLIFYGIFRFGIEFFRQPDEHKGFLALGMTEGQWLSLPMIVLGILLCLYSCRGKKTCSNI